MIIEIKKSINTLQPNNLSFSEMAYSNFDDKNYLYLGNFSNEIILLNNYKNITGNINNQTNILNKIDNLELISDKNLPNKYLGYPINIPFNFNYTLVKTNTNKKIINNVLYTIVLTGITNNISHDLNLKVVILYEIFGFDITNKKPLSNFIIDNDNNLKLISEINIEYYIIVKFSSI
jgi:hypothetical protein